MNQEAKLNTIHSNTVNK